MSLKIQFEKTEKNSNLLRTLASKNKSDALLAQEALADFVGPVIQEVINNAATMSTLFETFEYDENDSPSIPADLYTDASSEDYLKVWSQHEAGGLPYNMVAPPTNEIKVSTYKLDSAVAFLSKFARQNRLDVIAKTMTRLAQEVLLKQERNSAAVLLGALASATTVKKPGGAAEYHVIRSNSADTIVPADFLTLFTLQKRIKSSWNKGTPSVGQSRGVTDMLASPEIVEKLRGLAYNPWNTSGSNTDIPGTDSVRDSIFNSAGVPSFYGVNIIEINELGVGYKYNDIFDAYAGSNAYAGHGGSGTAQFNGASEEVCVALDLGGSNLLIRPVAVNSETGSQFNVEPDDQHLKRSGKIGFYGSLEEGRVVLDDRILTALIV